MCMIAHRPASPEHKGSNIPNAVIETALDRHPDGFGVAWREDGVLRHEKFGPLEFGPFRELLKRLDRKSDLEYVAHWRFATHGDPCKDLSHPFVYDDPIEGPVAVFHNGVISIDTFGNDQSDTSVFVDTVLSQLPTRWWDNPAIEYLVSEAIGYSKLIIMTAAETVSLQESYGKWDGGIWYSSEHRPYTPAAVITYRSPEAQSWDKRTYQKPTDLKSALAVQSDASTLWRPTGPTSYSRTVDEGDDMWGVWDDVYEQPVISGAHWSHGGHELQRLYDFDRKVEGEYPQSMMCDECFTMGDAYVIEGKTYIDIGHDFGTVFAEAEGE